MTLSSLVAFDGCDKKVVAPAETKASTNHDACALLTRDEVQAIQGSPVTGTKSSDRSDGIFRISQCYYFTVEANRSASLVMTERLGPGTRSPKEFWEGTFGRYGSGEENREAEEEERQRGQVEEKEREKAAPPKRIEGLGDGAYWTGDRIGGALYVLKGDAYFRISLGGPGTDEDKIEKSKALAQKILSRF